MQFSENPFTIAALVKEFRANRLSVNPEYQRGAVWTERQQGKFLDSLFRGYPVPAVFLRAIEHDGLRGRESVFELVDGQQRLRALAEFIAGKLRMPALTGPTRLRLPATVAAQPAPWAGRMWTELPAELRSQLENTNLRVFIVEHPTPDDEVRDLFIRLQAGTALTRQQIRDAWPGPIAPLVESLGGKGKRGPQHQLFNMVDKRGDRGSEEDGADPWVAHRQTCAQLLSVFIGRERDPYARPRVSAEELDELYHETSSFDPSGDVANRFRKALTQTERVFEIAAVNHPGRKTKWKKVHIFAVFLVVQDIQHARNVPSNDQNLMKLIEFALKLEEENRSGQRVRFSSAAIASVSERLRELFFGAAGRLHEQRTFSEQQQTELWDKADGRCQICSQPVSKIDAEYDHYPIPWAMCGPTEVENGRVVHKACHPRGRPPVVR